MIKFVGDLPQNDSFFSGYSFFITNRTDRRKISEIFFKAVLTSHNIWMILQFMFKIRD